MASSLRTVMSFEATDPVVCRCLGITESEVRTAGELSTCSNLDDVKLMTEAGTGCTSCHPRIIALLRDRAVIDHPSAAGTAEH